MHCGIYLAKDDWNHSLVPTTLLVFSAIEINSFVESKKSI